MSRRPSERLGVVTMTNSVVVVGVGAIPGVGHDESCDACSCLIKRCQGAPEIPTTCVAQSNDYEGDFGGRRRNECIADSEDGRGVDEDEIVTGPERFDHGCQPVECHRAWPDRTHRPTWHQVDSDVAAAVADDRVRCVLGASQNVDRGNGCLHPKGAGGADSVNVAVDERNCVPVAAHCEGQIDCCGRFAVALA